MKDKTQEIVNSDYQSWFFPEVSSPNTLVTVEKEESEKNEQLEIEKAAKLNDEVVETVEDVEQDITELISAEHLQKISEEAEQEGYRIGLEKGTKEGFQTGQKEGLAAAKKDTDDIMKRLHNLIEALLIPLKNEQDHLEKIVVKLVVQLVESIVGKAAQQPSSMIIDAVKKCLLALPHMTDHLTLHINSQDHQLIKESHVLSEYECHIVDDDQLMLGGCRLVSRDSSIDYTIETRLKLLIDEFVNQPLANQKEPSTAEPKLSGVESKSPVLQPEPSEPEPVQAESVESEPLQPTPAQSALGEAAAEGLETPITDTPKKAPPKPRKKASPKPRKKAAAKTVKKAGAKPAPKSKTAKPAPSDDSESTGEAAS